MPVRIDIADRLFSLWIKYRDEWTCQRCGKKYNPQISTDRQALHCSHFKGRGKEATRFDPFNADALCYGCHQYFTSQPDEHYKWQVAKKGQHIVDLVIQQSNTYKKKDRNFEKILWRTKLLDEYGVKV